MNLSGFFFQEKFVSSVCHVLRVMTWGTCPTYGNRNPLYQEASRLLLTVSLPACTRLLVRPASTKAILKKIRSRVSPAPCHQKFRT